MSVGNIILVTGQSNSLAFGTTGIPFPGWVANPKIKIWSDFHQNLEIYVPGTHADWPATWGPEAQYVLERAAAAPDESFFIIKHAGGGIFDHVPTSATGIWQSIITQSVCARALISALGCEPKVDSFLVIGGETDAQTWPVQASLFRYNLSSLFNATRLALGAPEMRGVISRIYPYWEIGGVVRPAQEAVGSEPLNSWADVDNVSKINDGHSDAAGTVEVGHRLFLADTA